MSGDIGHAEGTLELARQLLEERTDQMVGVWPRAVAFLTRQALEDAMGWLWLVHAPGVEECSAHAQLLCLRSYLGDEELAEEADHVYAAQLGLSSPPVRVGANRRRTGWMDS